MYIYIYMYTNRPAIQLRLWLKCHSVLSVPPFLTRFPRRRAEAGASPREPFAKTAVGATPVQLPASPTKQRGCGLTFEVPCAP